MKKKWLVPVLIAVLFVGILGIAFLATKDESVTKFWFEEEINVTDGVADITEHTIPFTLAEDDTYVVNVKWTAEKPGMISGAVLYDAEDKIRLYCTGDTVDVESAELELEAGDYYVTYMYFTNAEAFEEFVMAVDTTLPEDAEAYEYAENESYTMTYHFDIKYASSIAYRMGYLVGILAGVLVGLIAVAVCFEYVKIRKKGSNFEYDERQQLARGNGFKYAYVTGIVYNGVLCLLTMADITLPAELSVLIMIGILLTVLVYAIYCIQHDAYVSLNENANRLMIVFIALGGFNTFIGVMHVIHGTMFEDGIFTFHGINLLCGIFLLVVAVVLFVHTKLQSREEE